MSFRPAVPVLAIATCFVLAAGGAAAQSFGVSNLDFAGQGSVSSGTSLAFGPDGRLYVMQLDGTLDILTIERLGGNVMLESEPGEGTTVTLEIPIQ